MGEFLKVQWLAVALLVVSSSACRSSSSGGVTSVAVVAPAEVTGGLRFQLRATVEGSAADKTVRWSVDGGGTLVDASANPTFYVAPLGTASTTVHVKAMSARDTGKSGSADIRVVPAVPFVATVNPVLVPAQPSLPDGKGTAIQVAASRDAAGVTSEFLVGQVLIRPQSATDLATFLQRYQGVVIGDDSVPEPPASLGVSLTAAQRQAQSYLVRINTAAVSTGTFATDAAAMGLGGTVEFSSDDALRSMAAVTSATAAGFNAAPDRLEHPQDFPSILLSTEERPVPGGNYLDAFTATPDWSRFWTSGSQSNVTLAWQFLSARGITRRVRVAIIDGGFWLDTTGNPRGTDTDLPANPAQYNFNGDTAIADGPNPNNCSGNSSCFWHGNNSAGVAIGLISNHSGAAGVGGQVGDPILLKFNGSTAQRNRAIRTAAAWGADVVSMSFGGDCNKLCRIFDRLFTPIDDAVNNGSKAVFIAAAGNGDAAGNGYDVGAPHFVHPCLDDHVLCVGALEDDVATRKAYSNVGGPVRLFAPTDIPTMSSPAPTDNDGAGPASPQKHSGTSAATPFVAGVAAMVKAIAPDLTGDQVAQLLTDTAHPGASPVTRYVDAYAAVRKAAEGIAGVKDAFEPNNSEAAARPIDPGMYKNLNLDTDSDQDYFRLSFTKTTNVSINLAFMESLGRVTLGDGYGLAAQAGACGRFEQYVWRTSKNGLFAAYEVPAGTYFLKVSGRTNAYDLSWTAEDTFIFPVSPDSYEPNDRIDLATNLGSGASGSATITTGDVDWYRFDSPGSITNRYLTSSAGFGIRSTDVPLTLTLYDQSATQVGASVASDATCGSNPKFGNVPVGTFYVKVVPSTPGATGHYDFSAGVSARGGDGPVHDRVYQVVHPGDPIVGRFTDRYDGYMFTHSASYTALDLSARESLQLSLLDLTGSALAVGEPTFTGQSYVARLSLGSAVPGSQYLIQVMRTNAVGAAPPLQLPSVGYTMTWEGPNPPVLTTQPADVSVVAGQTATFNVVASGSAPLEYQWQRNGNAIAGATSASYTTDATVANDSGATFNVIVTNPAGTATSMSATLTVSLAAPVLSITAQPADVSFVAGATASFTVAATCSSGALAIQWQRDAPGTSIWTDLAGATAATTTFVSAATDNGAQFRAQLSCSGLSAATSNTALLTVTAPPAAMLAALPITGLRDNAEAPSVTGIVQDAAGSFTFITLNRLKRLSADLSTITPVAGGGSPAGFADGTAETARFNAPQGLTQDGAGVLYLTDTGNHVIRKIAIDGTVSTIAGSPGASGSADGNGSAARFNSPVGIALGPDGDLYVGDFGNHRIRRVTTAGVVTTYAGSSLGFSDGMAAAAQFNLPKGVAVAASGEVFVADFGNLRVRRITRGGGGGAGDVSTLAGNGTNSSTPPDGPGDTAVIPFPVAIVLRGTTLVVSDERGLLRQIDTTTGVVSTLAGTRTFTLGGYLDGAPGKGQLNAVAGIANMSGGGYMVGDHHSVRSISTTGVVRTIATTAPGVAWTSAGTGTLALEPIVMGPDTRQAVTVEPAGNVVIADYGTDLVRRIAPSGDVSLIAGLSGGHQAAVDGTANEAQFTNIGPIASDPAGVLYVTDNYGVRRIGTDNAVTFLAGSRTDFGNNDGSATTARFYELQGIAVGSGGNVFVSDHFAIRRIDVAGNVTTYAGVTGQAGDIDGPVATARFQSPRALALAPDGTLYVGDANTIRRVSADGLDVSRVTGVVYTGGLAVDAAGTLYYGDVAGLKMVPAGGTSTLLIPRGATTLGANPAVPIVFGIAVLGPKRLLLQTGFELLIATLP